MIHLKITDIFNQGLQNKIQEKLLNLIKHDKEHFIQRYWNKILLHRHECLNIKSGAILRVDKDLEQLNSHDLLLEIF